MLEKCSRARRSSRCRRLLTIGLMLIAALAAARSDAAGQTLTVDYEQVVTREMPGATAAFSLDPSCVGASAQGGQLTLVGRGPGSTNVIVIVGDETVSMPVAVREPAVTMLPGMSTESLYGGRSGYYEARYGSNPGMLQGNLFLSRRDGDRTAELSLGGAAPLEADLGAPFAVPLASFTLRTPNREITLLDRVVSNSPLTVSRSNIRGLHLRQGPWQVNAGYSFFSTFEHLLLPTDKEVVAGVGYRHRISPRTSLTPNIYYFDGARGRGRGPLGTLFYETRTAGDVKLAAELAVSGSIGGAFELELDRPNRRRWLKLRIAPDDLPALTTDQQSGQQLEGGWTAHGERNTFTANVASRRYLAGAFDQTSSVANVDLQRRLTRRWAVHGGSGFSVFEDARQPASGIRSVTLPAGTSFSGRNLGASFDYQFSRETNRDLGGHLVRANVSGSGRGFRLSMFGERQTQAPTARQILSEIPALQPILDRLGLAAGTPEQLADLLRTNAELAAFGYANGLQIDVTPVRTRVGANGGWTGSGSWRPQLSVSSFLNRNESVERTALGAVHSLSYSQKLDQGTDLFFTWSAVCHDRVASSSACQPAMFASLRRSLNGGPALMATRRGSIDGVVFKDDEGTGMYAPGAEPLAGVEVVLDNVRYARTDASGRFRFEGVPYGRHHVEARYASDLPTFFTTPSPAQVDTGGSVQFGIALSRSSLRGTVLTDAGLGLPGVVVQMVGAERRTTARTSDDGTFVADGLAVGDYDVAIDAASVPVGYPVDSLTVQRVRVDRTSPGRASFVLRPYRTVAGKARLFNRDTGEYVPLPGATVKLQPLGLQSVTDANGLYAFRDVPAGEYAVMVTHGGSDHRTAVSIPSGPAFVKDTDVAVLPAAGVVASSASLGDASRPAQAADDAVRSGEPRITKAVEQAPETSLFTVLVAESANARHAQAMVDELKGAGHAAYLVQQAVSAVGAPYHVRIGRYSTAADANRSARTLEKALGWRMAITTVSAETVVRGKTGV